MNWKTLAALGVAVAVGVAGWQCEALARQSKKRVFVRSPSARIVVTKRSYLDAGTEVKPGERKFRDYVYPPGYSPANVYDASRVMYGRSTLPEPYWLPGFD
jgi:hypothetical protein